MSAFVPPVPPTFVGNATQPPAGSVVDASNGEFIAITDPSANANDPTVIIAPDSGLITVSSATEGADIIIEGGGDAVIEIGNAVDAAGNVLGASGSTFQVDNDYEGTVIVNLDGAICDSAVDIETETSTGTIADALPGSGKYADQDYEYYINTGAGNDQIEGSQCEDFIRAGAGDDVVNAGAGDDLVRLGSGDDLVTLGDGNDAVYFTVDQLQGEQGKVITDFDAEGGDDKILIDENLQDLVTIDGLGSNAITIILDGAQTGITDVLSEGNTIDADDVEFV